MNPTGCSGSDAPRVQIISHSDAGELVCASAARISTTQGSALTVFERSKEKENNGTLIEKVVASGHRSVVEHAVFTVAFDNVSVCTEEFVIEFRLASYTVQSRRYVDFSDIGFYTPDMPQACEGPYKSHMTALFETYARLLDMGIPKEDARFVLPYCFRSNFYCTMNARELMHMMATMLWGRGREIPELVALGTSLKQQLEAFFPNLPDTMRSQYEKHNGDMRYRLPETIPAVAEPAVAAARGVLCSVTPEADETVRCAAMQNGAMTCALAPLTLEEIVSGERPRELELIRAVFRIEGLSLAAVTHLVRHRVQSVLVPQVMQAIVANRYVLPPTVAENPEAAAVYHHAFAENTRVLRELAEKGLPVSAMQYFAMAGHLLDCSCAMNGRELKHFFALRTCNRAQWEIRAVAEELLFALREHGEVFRLFGPSCYTGGCCPEGRFCCGKMQEMQRKYSR